MEPIKAMLRLRMSAKDAHYGGNLVDGAHMVHLFGDVATELLIRQHISYRHTIWNIRSAVK